MNTDRGHCVKHFMGWMRAVAVRGWLILGLVMGQVALQSCTPVPNKRPALSIEEALQVQSSFAGMPVEMPGRRIDDLIEELTELRSLNEKDWAEAREKADTEPSPQLSGVPLAEFLIERAEAAGVIGRFAQVIADGEKAYGLLKDSPAVPRRDIARLLRRIASTRLLVGSADKAISEFREIIKITKGGDWKTTLQTLLAKVGLTYAFAVIGEFEEAEKVSEQAVDDAKYRARRVNRTETTYWAEAFYPGKGWHARSIVLEQKGKLREAEELRRQRITALEGYERGRKNADITLSRIFLAENLRRQGRLIEAESFARRALSMKKRQDGTPSPNLAYQSLALYYLEKILADQGRLEESIRLARGHIALLQSGGVKDDSLVLNGIRNNLMALLGASGQWPAALAELSKTEEMKRNAPRSFKRLEHLSKEAGLVLLMNGHAERALKRLETARNYFASTLGEGTYLWAEAAGFEAMAIARLGQKGEAMRRFESAVPVLVDAETDGAFGQSSQMAAIWRRMILDSYFALLVEQKGETPAVAARIFRLAQAAKSGETQEAFANIAMRAAAGNPEVAILVRKRQDLTWQREALRQAYFVLASDTESEQTMTRMKKLAVGIQRIELALAAMTREIADLAPETEQYSASRTIGIEEARQALQENEALLVFHVATDQTYIWGVTKHGPQSFAVIDSGQELLRVTVSNIRQSLEPQGLTLGDITQFDLVSAFDLYEKLLKPVRESYSGADHLVVVADGPLQMLPLSLLPTRQTVLKQQAPLFSGYREVPWLARTHGVNYLPAVSSLIDLRSTLHRPAAEPYAGFGDPVFSSSEIEMVMAMAKESSSNRTRRADSIPFRNSRLIHRGSLDDNTITSSTLSELARLPGTADEVRSIAKAFQVPEEGNVFVGAEASETIVKTRDLSNRKVVVFATHGLLPRDLDGLSQPALALSAPEVTGGSEDGLLTMEEVMGLKLNADWVVLSACNTAAGDGKGAEAFSGLGRAFVYAGAQSMLLTHWPVETTSAKALTTELFGNYAQYPFQGRAEMLRKAKLAMIDGLGRVDAKGRTVHSYAHPFFWAPFTLLGEGAANYREK